MSDNLCEFLGPVSWLPAGLVSWYAPDGAPLVLVMSWLSLIGGERPRVRASWHGRQDALSRFWPGGDFVLNLPDQNLLGEVQRKMRSGLLCFRSDELSDCPHLDSLSVRAPRLSQCPTQIECCNGVLLDDGGEPELGGVAVTVHRLGATLSPQDIPELCAIRPLG
ncbi:MAG: hypothetical protein OET90_11555 [Desulfuromonadales bacterium]|nr:hypothetical protein [Desulfuromonadales bacterium]